MLIGLSSRNSPPSRVERLKGALPVHFIVSALSSLSAHHQQSIDCLVFITVDNQIADLKVGTTAEAFNNIAIEFQ